MSFSPTPIPEPVDPLPPPPQPRPDPAAPFPRPATGPEPCLTPGSRALRLRRTAYGDAYLEAFWDFNMLRLIDHAFGVLASHGIDPGGPFPLVCATCQKPWPFPLVTGAAGWIIVVHRSGLLAEFGIPAGGDILAMLGRWVRAALPLHT